MSAEIVLRDYQRDCCDAVDKAFADGQQWCLVGMPTASGKTVTFTETIWRRGAPALVLAHREELLDQAIEKLVAAGIDRRIIGKVMNKQDQHDYPVVVASVQTLARQARRAPLRARVWATIVVDEAHHAPAASYKAILADLVSPETLVLGVTATVNRKGMDEIWGEPVYTEEILDLIPEYLSDLRAKTINLDMSFKGIRKSHGDWQADSLAGAIIKADGPKIITQKWMEEGEYRQTIVFTPTVAVAHAVAAAFQERGIDAEAIDGTTPSAERTGAVERFRAGETKVLCNCALFTEGVDIPSIACVVIARPTLSPLLYAQMLGRGLRKHEGKEDCLVLDLAGASRRHKLGKLRQAEGPITVTDIVGVPVGPDGIRRPSEARQRQIDELVAQARYVSMVEVDPFGEDVRGPSFLQLDEATLMLPCANGAAVAVEGRMVFTLGTSKEGTSVTLAADEYGAMRLAAAIARGRGKPWRKKGEPTVAQIQLLLRVRPGLTWDVVEGLTSAQVSDLTDMVLAGRKLKQWRTMRGLTSPAA